MSEEKGEELEEQITKTPTEPIQNVKDPKRVGAGKRLAANNKRAREEAKARQKEEEENKEKEKESWMPTVSTANVLKIAGIVVGAANLY